MNGNDHLSSTLAKGVAPQRPLHDNRLPDGHTVISESARTYGNLRGGNNLAPPPLPEHLQNSFPYSEASFAMNPEPELRPNGVSEGGQAQSQLIQNSNGTSSCAHPQQEQQQQPQQDQEAISPSGPYQERQPSVQPLDEYEISAEELEEALQQELQREWELGSGREFEQQFEPAMNAATDTPQAANAQQSITNPPATHFQSHDHALPVSNANTTPEINNHSTEEEEDSLLVRPLVISSPTPEAAADFLNNLNAHMNSRPGQAHDQQQQDEDEQAEEEQRPGFIHVEDNPFRHAPSPSSGGYQNQNGLGLR